ncbi:MAG TPA: KTSC domain-containing protein, partial [Burkholderiales bacterium]
RSRAHPLFGYYSTRHQSMERKRVNSSKIRAVGYDPKSQVLEVEFSDGKLVQYRGVSPEVHRQFMAAPSATSFFEDKIDENFPSSRIK